ncbi:TRAP transporter small permease [Rhodocaloribacter litoris]|uniref:TRAP transporter small permease n=1 Tax=Rhodocaloribacter litoris TaxID=2558931 RepID=UPI001423CA65|nr:TRAP transporter small permease [Rhodocaloribacter litoris]QXD14451.1 TRAP transporter small permease [Rhodocaloribacter litoris]
MEKLRRLVDRGLAGLLVGVIGLAVLNVLWQVFTRWVLRDPSSYTEELARYLLIWIGLLGAAYAAGQKLHLAIDLLPGRLTGRARHLLELAIGGCVFVFALAVMVVGGSRLVLLTLRFEQTSAALGVPLGYVYLVLPLSGLLIMFYALADGLGQWRAWRPRRDEPPAPGAES